VKGGILLLSILRWRREVYFRTVRNDAVSSETTRRYKNSFLPRPSSSFLPPSLPPSLPSFLLVSSFMLIGAGKQRTAAMRAKTRLPPNSPRCYFLKKNLLVIVMILNMRPSVQNETRTRTRTCTWICSYFYVYFHLTVIHSKT
jgi:hypothetical protein